MKAIILAGLLMSSVASLSFLPKAASSEPVVTKVPTLTITDSAHAPSVSAKAYSVIDLETGAVLLSHNADEELPIASITKLFTAAVALDREALETETQVTLADTAAEGRAGKLEVGQNFTLRELLFPLLLESSNDAATVFGRTLGQISFPGVRLADASGLSSQNIASANILASDIRQLFYKQPYLFDITKLPQYIGIHTGWVNNSPVRDLPGYQGGKHGYTEAANRTLAAIFNEPALGNRSVGYVILGSADLRADTIALRNAVADSVQLQ